MNAEDAVLRDTIILVVTAPLWLAGFGWLVVAGWWNDRKAGR